MGSHPPTGIDGSAVADSGDGGASSEVAGNDAELICASELCAALGDEAMTGSMKSVAPNSVFGFPLPRNRKAGICYWEVVVESGFESSDAGQIGVTFGKASDGGDVRWVVGGQEGIDFLHGQKHLFVKELRSRDSAGHHGFEADGGEFIKATEEFFDESNGRPMVGEGGSS